MKTRMMVVACVVVVLIGLLTSLAHGVLLEGSYLVPDSTVTESHVYDNYNYGGGIQNYINYHEGQVQYEWAHLWVDLNTAYRVTESAWTFDSEPGSSQWTATLDFAGVETMDNVKSSVYSPAFFSANGWETYGGVSTSCEYGTPLWANLNASLAVSPNAKVNYFVLQFSETANPTGVTTFRGVYTAHGEFVTVPEPGTLVLMLGALSGVLCVRRRKPKHSKKGELL